MSSSLGFVVLARRPGQPAEPVSAVFPAYPNGLEQAQNALESCERKRTFCDCLPCQRKNELNPVEYVIGEISERTP